MKTAVWWIRRDLRLRDNQALTGALRFGGQVLPVFVLDPKLLNSTYSSEKRLTFLFEGLRSLESELQARGSYLLLRRGEPVAVLLELLQELGAEAVFAEEDISPYARRRDAAAAQHLPLHLVSGLTARSPREVVKADGTPYTVFTPFSRAWLAQESPTQILPAPDCIPTPAGITGVELPEKPVQISFVAGEKEAQIRLSHFVDHVLNAYADERDRMDLSGTSWLSPYLRFGMLSAREAVDAVRRAGALSLDGVPRSGADAWLNELIWREFFMTILYHFPDVRQRSFRPQMRSLHWLNDPDDFAAWKEGRTGYPVVDAAMRQLNQTGWMHNRARMITASFLTKDLLIDWRWGERYFMQQLIDGDPAANNGGWQWSAGTGTDAAPYFRVFNPVLQGMKFDPAGEYVRRWVPELAGVPAAYIQEPWKMPAEIQNKLGFVPGSTYPAPIVDHALARRRALAAYRP
jgi:deoxyribodipyrimidine photo-lyase